MSVLAGYLDEYLALRRALGYRLVEVGRLLHGFVEELERRGVAHVTTEVALAWATAPSTRSPARAARRLAVVRQFAEYLTSFDEGSEVPPAELLQGSHTRQTPYLFSPGEILALMASARRLTPPLRAASYETLIGLMAATGIRTGEALALDRSDVDLRGGLLIVRCSKFGKSRQVPLHATTAAALRSYAGRRDRACPRPSTPSFLVSHAGTRLGGQTSATFRGLLVMAGVVTPPSRRRPRLYDLRHSFAVATLLSWHAAGADVQQQLPLLSTYMGHLNPKNTYWYLEAAPELMAILAARLEHYQADLP